MQTTPQVPAPPFGCAAICPVNSGKNVSFDCKLPLPLYFHVVCRRLYPEFSYKIAKVNEPVPH